MRRSLWLSLALLAAVSASARAEPPAGVRINNLKVLSDRIEDVTTAENILASFVKPGMSDAERARAIWKAVVRYRHQTLPPNEYLATDWEVHDPVKLFNVYGYCMCCCSTALIEALNRLDGREARGRILTGHSVPEVRYGGNWHMFDASLINYFPRPDGEVASVDDLASAVRGWHDGHPGYRGKSGKLVELMRQDGWMGWKRNGPDLLAACPFLKLGYYPARTHGWDSTMVEYDRKCEVYEYGYHVGHRALFSLRPGESFVREAGNRGLHVNQAERKDWPMLRAQTPKADLAYVPEFMPGYTGGVVANGYHRYAPLLAREGLAGGADMYENVTAGADGILRPRDTSKPGVVVVPLTSPYVYLGGRVTVKARRKSESDRVTLALSTNNGRSFTPIWQAPVGQGPGTFELGKAILRRYAYWLRIELTAATPEGAALEALAIENDIQHAPRALPWLGKGSNTITVAADGDTALASRAITCRITPDRAFDKNESTTSMGVAFDNLDLRDGSCWWKSGTGTMTVPVETPGDLRALRFCAQIRARGVRDLIRVLVSFNDGKDWREAARLAGPTPGHTATFRFTDIPKNIRHALLRFELTGNNTIGVMSFRVDADYLDSRAAKGIAPFDVIYRWKEEGQEKTQRAHVTELPSRFTIETKAAPEMMSVTCAMPTADR
jgi:hypothetical protein